MLHNLNSFQFAFDFPVWFLLKLFKKLFKEMSGSLVIYAPAQITGTSTFIPTRPCPEQIPWLWLKLTVEQMRCEITWNLRRGAEQNLVSRTGEKPGPELLDNQAICRFQPRRLLHFGLHIQHL